MNAVVQAWGNSLGIRIPAIFVRQLNIRRGQTMIFDVRDDEIVLRKPTYSLEELCAGITDENRHQAVFTDIPVGKEVW